MHPVSCANTHHYVTDLANHRMVQNTKLDYLKNGRKPSYKIKKILNFASYDTFCEVTVL